MSISSQSSSSSLHKTIHLDQISTIHVQSCTKLPSEKHYYCNRALSIEALRVIIFTFLPPLAAVNACHINKTWLVLENNVSLWRAKFSQDIRDAFDPLVDQKLVTWPKVPLYARLSFFIASIIEGRHSWGDVPFLKNPELHALINNPRLFSNTLMPKPFAKYGNCHYAICNLTNIEVHEEGSSASFLLKGEKRLTHLVAQGKDVFALAEDGVILHWNNKTREKDISTAYSTGSEDFKREKKCFLNTRFCDGFYIKNGIIIISYVWKDFRGPVRLLEIIPSKNPEKRQLIENFPLVRDLAFIEVLEDQIIMMGRDSTYRLDIWKIALPKLEEDTLLTTPPLFWTTLSQNSLEAITRICPINKVELDCDPSVKIRHKCMVIQNLLFDFDFCGGQLSVNVMRINAENISYVDRFEECHLELHCDTPQWRTDILKRLLSIAQSELYFKPKPKPKSKPTNCCVIA